ncbi:curli assembly protein CsgF [Vibrio genomosp. F10]|uniref:Curli production assembly/transport component CsgF n=1 Tax=Vibrio genomosp. F10 TaxID=723171 RepID=A0A1B9QWK8_9VIBR|nr:curli assembly protein CsgF [Vibrio genomosp. F10]OCH74022.1 curli production assembly protein CsgF [Vibrio genomosp. F10]
MKTKITMSLLLYFTPFINASEMIYTPNNPSFGGFSGNSSHLLGVANAINDYKAPASSSAFEEESAIDRLASSLESRLISQLLADIGTGNTTGNLVTEAFTLNVQEEGSGLAVIIIDNETGESTKINVSGLNPDL